MKMSNYLQKLLLSYSERRSPSQRLNECSVECTEIDECIRGQVKVGNQRSNNVQFGNEQENGRNEKY